MIPVYCPLCCDQPFDDQDSLFHHLRTLRNNLFCPICSERFGSFDLLVTHLSRKCHGPASPHEAKRKCLSNTKLPDTLPVPSLDPLSSTEQSATLDEKTDVSKPAASPGEMCNLGVATPAPAISPEIQSGFSRKVSLSMANSTRGAKPLSTSLEDQNPHTTSLGTAVTAIDTSGILNRLLTRHTTSPGIAVTASDSSGILSKHSLNPQVDIGFRVDKNIECKLMTDSGKSAQQELPLKQSLSANITSNDPQSSPPNKRSRKAGPLSAKLRENQSKRKRDQSFSQVASNSNLEPENNVLKPSSGEEVSLRLENECPRSGKKGHPTKTGFVDGQKNTSEEKSNSNLEPEHDKAKETNSEEKVNLQLQTESSKSGRNISKRSRRRKISTTSDEDDSLDEVLNSNSEPGNKNAKETNSKSEVNLNQQKEFVDKRGRQKKISVGRKTPVMNGINERLNCDTNINSSAQLTEAGNTRPVRRSAKKIISYNKLLNSDDSNDSNNFESKASSDSDYVPEEIQPSFKVEECNLENDNKETNNDQDKTEQISDAEPEELIKRSESINIESEQSSSNVDIEVKDQEMKSDNSSSLPETKTEEEEYTCSACNIQFSCIYEHIKKYHNGQEVVVEVPPEEIQEDLKAYQENSESKISIGEASETQESKCQEISDPKVSTIEEAKSINMPTTGNEDNLMDSAKEEIISPKATSQIGDKRKREISGFMTAGASDDLVYTKTIKKIKDGSDGRWVQLMSEKKRMFMFVRNECKYRRLMSELRNNNSIHPKFDLPVKKLFENPKINIVQISYQPNSPFTIQKTVDLKTHIPMFIVDRQDTNNPEMLGGIASYVMAGKESDSDTVAEDSKVIGVMKVILASDKQLTVENIVFNDKPTDTYMVPVLEDVKNPDIPLLKNSKILKWRCNKCLATTWKFPVHKETHFCNACPICHKTFVSPVSLKKHLVLHKRDGTKYCKECRAAFISKITLNSHLEVHVTHVLCDMCHIFIPREKEEEHREVHSRDPFNQFPCSICKKVFGSGQDLKSHETKLCSKLVSKFNCSYCDKKFFTLMALSYHTMAHNKVALKFRCRFCPKVFLQEKEQCPKNAGKRKPSIYLQKIWHEKIHTRDRPHMCQSCPKRFRSIAHETFHHKGVLKMPRTPVRTVHVHMCTYCDKVFRSEKELISHMEQHTAVSAEQTAPSTIEHTTVSLAEQTATSTPNLTIPSTIEHNTATLTEPSTVEQTTAMLTEPSTVEHATATLTAPSTVENATATLTAPSTVEHTTATLTELSTDKNTAATLTLPSTVEHATATLTPSSTVEHNTATLTPPSAVEHATATLTPPSTVEQPTATLSESSTVEDTAATLTPPSTVDHTTAAVTPATTFSTPDEHREDVVH